MELAVFCIVAPCSLPDVCRRFRGVCCLHDQGDMYDYVCLLVSIFPSFMTGNLLVNHIICFLETVTSMTNFSVRCLTTKYAMRNKHIGGELAGRDCVMNVIANIWTSAGRQKYRKYRMNCIVAVWHKYPLLKHSFLPANCVQWGPIRKLFKSDLLNMNFTFLWMVCVGTELRGCESSNLEGQFEDTVHTHVCVEQRPVTQGCGRPSTCMTHVSLITDPLIVTSGFAAPESENHTLSQTGVVRVYFLQ
jgi:hypothetical protein